VDCAVELKAFESAVLRSFYRLCNICRHRNFWGVGLLPI